MNDTKLRVLFVDDESEILNGLRLTLRKERKRWDMLFAENGEEALTMLDNQVVDVVCTDLQMPGINGSELLTRMAASHPGVCRIVISGHADDTIALRALSLAHRFLVKPSDRDSIVEAINAAHSSMNGIVGRELRDMVAGTHCLSPSPALHTELVTLLAKKTGDTESIVRIVQQDPALSAKLLQFANSAYISATSDVMSVAGAISVLEFSTLESIVPALQPATGNQRGAFQQRSTLVSRVAEHIARDMDINPAIASTAGLLADVGLLLLETKAPVSAARAEARAIAEDRPLFETQRLEMDVDHAHLGAALLASWGLPTDIVDAIRLQHAPTKTDSNEILTSGALHIAHYLAHKSLDQLAAHQNSPPKHLDLAYVHTTGTSAKLRDWDDFTRTLAEHMLQDSDTKAA